MHNEQFPGLCATLRAGPVEIGSGWNQPQDYSEIAAR
jgi:hypothetical protein